MSITAHDPHLSPDDPAWGRVERSPLDRLLSGADVVSVHLPLTGETRGLLGAESLALIRPTAVLVNTSRGGIVDEEALADALRERRLGGAALDVFAEEPLGPEAAARFRGLPNLILTPHLAGNTVEAVDRIATTIVEAVEEALSDSRASRSEQ